MFEHYGFEGAYIAIQAVLTLYAQVRSFWCSFVNFDPLISISNVGTLNKDKCLIPQLKLSLQGMTTMGYRRGITRFTKQKFGSSILDYCIC